MAEGSVIERLIVALLRREQPLLRLAPSVVDAQPFEQNRRQRDVSWDTALAPAYIQDHPLAIDVAHLQMAQFIAAQGRGIEGGDDGPMLQVAGLVEYARSAPGSARSAAGAASWEQQSPGQTM